MQIPWHLAHEQLLIQQTHAQKLAHAWLCQGPKGLGKFRFIGRMAQWLLCHQPIDDQPCGLCRSCQCFQQDTHPDWLQVMPTTQAGSIGIDQIRTLSERLTRSPSLSSRRVIAIAPVEAMASAAMNALLKTLEEPASHSILFLLTHKPSMLPMTISSRAQSLVFKQPIDEQAISWLQKNTDDVSHDQASVAWYLCQKSPFGTLRYLQDTTHQSYLQSMLHGLLVRDKPWHLWAESWQEKEAVQDLAILMMQVLVDIIKVQSGNVSPIIASVVMPFDFQWQNIWSLQQSLVDSAAWFRPGSGWVALHSAEHLCHLWYDALDGMVIEGRTV